MKKFALIVGSLTLIAVIAGAIFLGKNDNGETNAIQLPTHHRYFWSKTCPHCTNVAEFVETWDGKDMFEMEKFEINESQENKLLFLESGTKICKKPANRLVVPLVVTPDGKCYSGDTPIIEYLKNI